MHKRVLTLFPIAFIFFGCVTSENLQLKPFTMDVWEDYRLFYKDDPWAPNSDVPVENSGLHKNFGSSYFSRGLGVEMLLKDEVPIDIMRSGALWCDVSTIGNHMSFDSIYVRLRKHNDENWLVAFLSGKNEKAIFHRADVKGIRLNCNSNDQDVFNSYQLNLYK